ncbi:hypothetical protein [Nocardia arthritidis]|uniref:hypothetical protein n=1 Tax=Nocardia arthritidis TaxID=228602 RepID=UPI0007A4FB7B|nr:hypothetical protein [Nocardia arthritidis]
MRLAVLVGVVLVVSACSQSMSGNPRPVAGPAQSTSPPAQASANGLRDRIAWVQQGSPIDLAAYHSATIEGGPVTDLRGDIAFVSPTHKISCITGVEFDFDGFDCMIELKNPAPAPGEGYGQWFGGYVTYSGQRLTVGQFRGDPGLFIHGEGPTLPYDSMVTFGEYLCRLATTGLTCVNPTTGSGVQMSSEGVVPLGCLHELPEAEREPAVGRAYAC